MRIENPSHCRVIAARVTPDQRHQAEAAAEDLGVTMSSLARLALVHFLDLKPEARGRYALIAGERGG